MKDIINKKKSLRDIFPDNHAGNGDDQIIKSEEQSFKTKMYEPQNNNYPSPTGLSLKAKIFIGVIALALILAGGFAISAKLATITVKVSPRQGKLLVSNTYEATQNKGDVLSFILASNIQAEDKVSVPASGSEAVKEKASGQIIIYNNHSTANQALIASTRFETKDGLVYRIPKAITVPGQTKDASGQIKPGQVETTVIADQPGEKYNIESAEFAIPGFKGSAKYTTFSAKSKGAMTGGFIGNRPKVSTDDMAKARQELEKKLLADLGKRLAGQVPAGYVLFADALIADFVPQITTDDSKANQAILHLKANGTAILFDKKELASYLAKQQVPDYQGEPVEILNWEDFKFNLLDRDKLSLAGLDKINFKLDGTGELVWTFDEKAMKEKLQKGGASNYKLIFENDFKMIKAADIIFTPPWIRSIPSNPEKIKIETNVTRSWRLSL